LKKSFIAAALVGPMALQGCGSNTAPPAPGPSEGGPTLQANHTAPDVKPDTGNTPPAPTAQGNDPVIARLSGNPIRLSQIQPILLEGYGLGVLQSIVLLEAAKQEAARTGVVVSIEDVNTERALTQAKLFPDAEPAEIPKLYQQFLEQKGITVAEFDLLLQTNAYLRKMAEPMVKGKITDAALEEMFRQRYGENVQVRHIQATNLQEIGVIKERLNKGEPFEKVAAEMSRNVRTAPLGGELPPFSRQALGYPQVFKDVAFSLKEGEVSDVVSAEGAYHLIKLERRIAPRAVKFEDVKPSLTEDLHETLVQAVVKQLRTQIAEDARRGLIIDHPVLKAQYDSLMTQRDQQITDRNAIREQFERERQKILERAATQPTSMPATQPATAPATQN
jgi:parvulin-like peptidyl-prolyl isomerase